MKKVIAFMLVLVLLLCGCNSESSSKKDREDTEETKKTEPTQIMDATQSIAETTDNEESYDQTEETTEPEKEVSEKDILIGEYMADESGYWAGYYYYGNKSSKVIFDSKKEVVYTFADDEDRDIYSNGRFISTIGEAQYLKDALGNEICSTESLAINGFGMTRNTARNASFLADGYVLAYRITESLSSVTYEIGVLDRDGNWLIELSDQNPLLSCGFKCDVDSLEERLIYVGDGCLMVPVTEKNYNFDYRLYNLKTNQVYDIVKDGSGSSTDYMCSIAELENGVSYGKYKANMYEIHDDGTVKTYKFTPEDVTSDDIYGFLIKDGVIYSLVHDDDTTSIVTANGYIASVTGFDLIDCVAMDDYFMITAENANDTVYYAAIDLEGNFLFEPVQTDAATIILTNGVELSTNDDVGQPTGTKIVVDESGNIVYESQSKTTEMAVKNGIIREAEDLDSMENEDIYTRLP